MTMTIKDLLKHSFVITIDGKRFEDFKKVFKHHGLSPMPKRFGGVTLWYNSPQYNCYLSHRNAILEAKRRKWPYVCVFEDDAYPRNGVVESLERGLVGIPDGCGALALGWITMLHSGTPSGSFMKGVRMYGAHSYIVFADAYDQYVSALDANPEGDGAMYAPESRNPLGRDRFYATSTNNFIQYSKDGGMNNGAGYIYIGEDRLMRDETGHRMMIPRDKRISEGEAVGMGFPPVSDIFGKPPSASTPLVTMREGSLRQGLLDLISRLDMDGISMIEVGSYAGESSGMFASSGKVRELVCIDPWQGGYDPADEASSTDFAEVESRFDAVMRQYPSIIRKFKGTLEGYVAQNPDARPDMVYIDACHTYEGCRADILNALKLKPKVVAGHDYAHWCPGVVKAVDETLGVPPHRFMDGSWMFVMDR